MGHGGSDGGLSNGCPGGRSAAVNPPCGGLAPLATFRAMRILSGIQPSGALHIGNYFGMMKPAIDLQERGEAYYFIANYHSMTSLYDAAQRRQNTLDVALRHTTTSSS